MNNDKNLNKPTEIIPFNEWSRLRIRQGRKHCTSRKRIWNDSRVIDTAYLPWWFIKKYLWKLEGADSPDELQKVVNMIFRRVVENVEFFHVHFGDFEREVENV